jgi:hypothetical protein
MNSQRRKPRVNSGKDDGATRPANLNSWRVTGDNSAHGTVVDPQDMTARFPAALRRLNLSMGRTPRPADAVRDRPAGGRRPFQVTRNLQASIESNLVHLRCSRSAEQTYKNKAPRLAGLDGGRGGRGDWGYGRPSPS